MSWRISSSLIDNVTSVLRCPSQAQQGLWYRYVWQVVSLQGWLKGGSSGQFGDVTSQCQEVGVNCLHPHEMTQCTIHRCTWVMSVVVIFHSKRIIGVKLWYLQMVSKLVLCELRIEDGWFQVSPSSRLFSLFSNGWRHLGNKNVNGI